MTSEEDKNRIREYVHKHPGCTEEEISAVLKIHIVDVLNALVKMEKEGELKSEEIVKSVIL